MAFAKRKSGGLVVHRSKAPSVPKKKYLTLVNGIQAKKKKAAEVANRRMGALVGVGAAYAVGYLEKTDKMPKMPGGIEPTLVLGAVLGFVAPEFIKGKAGQVIAETGAAIAGVAAYKLATGTPIRVAGEEDDE